MTWHLQPIPTWQFCLCLNLRQVEQKNLFFPFWWSDYAAAYKQYSKTPNLTIEHVYEWWRWSGEWERQKITLSSSTVSQLWGFKEAWMKFPSWSNRQTVFSHWAECHLFLILNLFSTDILFISETPEQSQLRAQTVHTLYLPVVAGLQTSSRVLATCLG